MSDRFDVIVVGGGHNGLCCAAYLAKSGRKVLVLEAADVAGGAAVTREFSPGFHVSACAHVLHMLHPQVVKDLDLEARGLAYAAIDLDTIALSPDGRHLRLNGRRLEGENVTPAGPGDERDALGRRAVRTGSKCSSAPVVRLSATKKVEG